MQLKKNEKDKAIDILSEYEQERAIKIKKIYSEMFGKDLLKYIKDDEDIDEDIKIYLSFLLSNYFFPKIHNDEEEEKMAEQLINMKKSNDIDLNFISYVFQSNRISIIKNIYKEGKRF